MTDETEGGTGLIPIGAIGAAPVEQPVTEPKSLADPLTGIDPRLNQHLGKIGTFVGGGPEKAGNIAFIVIIVAALVLVISAIGSALIRVPAFAPVLDKLITGSITLITGALGYLFGASKDGKG